MGARKALLVFCLALLACTAPLPETEDEGSRAATVLHQPPSGPPCTVTRVVDGDTVVMACRDLGSFRARLMGYDTPEISRPRCREELLLGLRAKERMRQMLADAHVLEVSFHGTDRYGRMLTRLSLDGTDVARRLISEGLAVQYSGGRRINWCARLT